jgi:hypothetical protein
MNARLAAAVMASLVTMAVTVRAEAQTSRLHLGAHASYNFDAERLGIGPQLSIPIARHLEFYPSFDWFFVDGGTLWGLNADLKYRLHGEGWNWLYVGGGLNLTRSNPDVGSSHTDSHLNVLVGAESLRGRVHPYVELRGLIGNNSTAQLAAGLNFTLGRH